MTGGSEAGRSYTSGKVLYDMIGKSRGKTRKSLEVPHSVGS